MVAATSTLSNVDILLGNIRISPKELTPNDWVRIIQFALDDFPGQYARGMRRIQEMIAPMHPGRLSISEDIITSGMPNGFPKNMAFHCLGIINPLPPEQIRGKMLFEIPGKMESSLLLLNRESKILKWESRWNFDTRREGPQFVAEWSRLSPLSEQTLAEIFSVMYATDNEFGRKILFNLWCTLRDTEVSLNWELKKIQPSYQRISLMHSFVS